MNKENHILIEKLIRGLSHELKNPLTTVTGYAQLLGMDTSDAELRKKSREIIIQQVDRIDRILEGLYRIFSLKSGGMVQVHLMECLEEVRKELGDRFPCNIAIKSIKNPALVNADPALFKKMLLAIAGGFDWVNNFGVSAVVEEYSAAGRHGFKVTFSGCDFSDLESDSFYLPYVSKKNYTNGTELYEASVIALLFGWDFELIVAENTTGFGVLF